MKIIISAGGQGSKLWPYSRELKPKQFQKIIGHESLFTYNVNLLLKNYKPEDLYITIKRPYLKWAVEQAPYIPLKNYIIEPDVKTDRGPSEGYASLRLLLEAPDEPVMIAQSDVLRYPDDKYLSMITEMEKLVTKDRKFITGGTRATYPTLGVDYIRLGDKIPNDTGLEIYKSEEFIDRTDDYAKTQELIENFHITIHAAHTCWYPELMLEAYKTYKPDWYETLMTIKDLYTKKATEEEIENVYATMSKGNTEMVTRHALEDGYVVLLPYKWSDIGTWDSVYQYFAKNGEIYKDEDTKLLALDSCDSLVKTSSKDKLVVLSDVENLLIIDMDDVLLVAPKNKAESIKKIRKALEDNNLSSYL